MRPSGGVARALALAALCAAAAFVPVRAHAQNLVMTFDTVLPPGLWQGAILGPSSDSLGYWAEVTPLELTGTTIERIVVQPEYDSLATTWNDVLRVQTSMTGAPLPVNIRVYDTSGLSVVESFSVDLPPGIQEVFTAGVSDSNTALIVEVTPQTPGNNGSTVDSILVSPEFDGFNWLDIVRVQTRPEDPIITVEIRVYAMNALPAALDSTIVIVPGPPQKLLLGRSVLRRGHVPDVTPLAPVPANFDVPFIRPEFDGQDWNDVMTIRVQAGAPEFQAKIRASLLIVPELSAPRDFVSGIDDDAIHIVGRASPQIDSLFGDSGAVDQNASVLVFTDPQDSLVSDPSFVGSGMSNAEGGFDAFAIGDDRADPATGQIYVRFALPTGYVSGAMGIVNDAAGTSIAAATDPFTPNRIYADGDSIVIIASFRDTLVTSGPLVLDVPSAYLEVFADFSAIDTGLGSGNVPFMSHGTDESDNDGDWSLLDDLGRDGIDDTGDIGEYDGEPTTGDYFWDVGGPDGTGAGNGAYDLGEPFIDWDGDGQRDRGEPNIDFTDPDELGVYSARWDIVAATSVTTPGNGEIGDLPVVITARDFFGNVTTLNGPGPSDGFRVDLDNRPPIVSAVTVLEWEASAGSDAAQNELGDADSCYAVSEFADFTVSASPEIDADYVALQIFADSAFGWQDMSYDPPGEAIADTIAGNYPGAALCDDDRDGAADSLDAEVAAAIAESKSLDPDGVDNDNDGIVDEGFDGIDNDGDQSIDEIDEREIYALDSDDNEDGIVDGVALAPSGGGPHDRAYNPQPHVLDAGGLGSPAIDFDWYADSPIQRSKTNDVVTGAGLNLDLAHIRNLFGIGEGGQIRLRAVVVDNTGGPYYGPLSSVDGVDSPPPGPEGDVFVSVIRADQTGFSLDGTPPNSPSGNSLPLAAASLCFRSFLGPAVCVVEPASLDFDSVLVGASADRQFAIQNAGGGTLTGAATISPGACPDFQIVGSAAYALSAGEFATITVRFSPGAEGTALCSIDAGSPLCANVAAAGAGVLAPVCSVTPASLEFDSVFVGESADESLTIANTGGGTLAGTAQIDSTLCPDFRIVGAAAYALAAGESATITVRFAPLGEGARECSVETGAGSCTDLSAAGVGVLAAACEVSPASIDFGSVAVGDSAERSLTIRNIGGRTLTGTAAVDSSKCPDFRIVGSGAYALSVGDSAMITVRFAPIAEGPRFCSIDAGSVECASVGATGAGFLAPVCSVAPATLDFDSVFTGQSAERSFTIANSGGGTLAGVARLDSLACLDFEIIGGAPYALAAGESVAVIVRFSPLAEGPRLCAIDAGAESCADVSASGTGVLPAAACEVSPTAIAFGSVAIGDSAQSALTIRNIGARSLAGTVSIDSLACPEFRIAGAGDYELADGDSFVVVVRFSPSDAGERSCEIAIGNESCGDVEATGAGAFPECEVAPESLVLEAIAGDVAAGFFEIANRGSGLLAGSVAESCDDFFIVGPPEYSLRFDESRTFPVVFNPQLAGPRECAVNTGAGCAALRLRGIAYDRGDVNKDGARNEGDVAMLLSHVLEIEPLPDGVVALGLADANVDSLVNVADIVRVANLAAAGLLRDPFAEPIDIATAALSLEHRVEAREIEIALTIIAAHPERAVAPNRADPAIGAAAIRLRWEGAAPPAEVDFESSDGAFGHALARENGEVGLILFALARNSATRAPGGAIPVGTLVWSEASSGRFVFDGGRIAAPNGTTGAIVATDSRDESSGEAGIVLSRAQPNPFANESVVAYRLAVPSDARLSVHDSSGRRVRTLDSGPRVAGEHVVSWDGRDDAGVALSAGVYFLRLETPGALRSQRAILIR